MTNMFDPIQLNTFAIDHEKRIKLLPKPPMNKSRKAGMLFAG